MRRSVVRYLGWVLAIVLLLLIAPNLLWLGISSVRIHNASTSPIEGIGYIACEETHSVGTLRAGQSVFRRLPACGEDTLEVLIMASRFCQSYVEGALSSYTKPPYPCHAKPPAPVPAKLENAPSMYCDLRPSAALPQPSSSAPAHA